MRTILQNLKYIFYGGNILLRSQNKISCCRSIKNCLINLPKNGADLLNLSSGSRSNSDNYNSDIILYI